MKGPICLKVRTDPVRVLNSRLTFALTHSPCASGCPMLLVAMTPWHYLPVFTPLRET